MLVCDIVCALVGDDVGPKVTMQRAGDLIEFTIDVPHGQAGRVIGTEGRTIRAIRTIVHAVARRQGMTADVREFDRRKPPPLGIDPVAIDTDTP